MIGSLLKQNRRKRKLEEKEKESFLEQLKFLRGASHKTSRKSSRVIVWDYSGQCPVKY